LKSILIHQFQTIESGLILLTGLFAVYGNVIGLIMIGQSDQVADRKKLIGLIIPMIGVFL
jgi:hypothetical protein